MAKSIDHHSIFGEYEAKENRPTRSGVKHLAPEESALYETAAMHIRQRRGRVRLDAYWWGSRE